MRRRSTCVWAWAAAAVGTLTAAVSGGGLTEDFQDGPGVPGFDPSFNHFFHAVGNPAQQAVFWALSPSGGGVELVLAPATDEVTFNLGCDIVDFASVTIRDGCSVGCTSVEFVGTNGSMTFFNALVGVEETFDTTGLNLGEIEKIRLTSFEGFFLRIVVNVTEDPCAPDVDGDGIIGFEDLLAVLSFWGPCP